MPRGIYDRSKSKSQRAAEKASAPAVAAPKQSKKYGKRAQKFSAPGDSLKNQARVGGLLPHFELQSYLRDLTGLRAILANGSTAIPGNCYSLVNQIDAELSKALTSLSAHHFQTEIVTPVQTNGAAPAPVAAAPAPFNPPTFTPAPTQA